MSADVRPLRLASAAPPGRVDRAAGGPAERKMSDPIQRDLEAWHLRADRAASLRALSALTAEWRPRVRRRFPGSLEEAEDALQDALIELAVKTGAYDLPRCARVTSVAPRSFRILVLQRFLHSRFRSQIPRERAVQAEMTGISARAAREASRAERARRASGQAAPALVEVSYEEAHEDVMEPFLRASSRAEILHAGHHLPIEERVLLMLVLGADVTPYAEALSARLQRHWPEATPDAVFSRMGVAASTDWNEHARVPPEFCQVVHFGSREAASKDGRRLWDEIEEFLRHRLGRGWA